MIAHLKKKVSLIKKREFYFSQIVEIIESKYLKTY